MGGRVQINGLFVEDAMAKETGVIDLGDHLFSDLTPIINVVQTVVINSSYDMYFGVSQNSVTPATPQHMVKQVCLVGKYL